MLTNIIRVEIDINIVIKTTAKVNSAWRAFSTNNIRVEIDINISVTEITETPKKRQNE